MKGTVITVGAFILGLAGVVIQSLFNGARPGEATATPAPVSEPRRREKPQPGPAPAKPASVAANWLAANRTVPSLTFSRIIVSSPDAAMTARPSTATASGYSWKKAMPIATAQRICE